MYISNLNDTAVSLSGILILVFLIVVTRRATKRSILCLYFFSVVFAIQYFVTICIVTMLGSWSSFVLSPQEVGTSLKYAAISGMSVAFGYFISTYSENARGRKIRSKSHGYQWAKNWRKNFSQDQAFRVSILSAFLVMILILAETAWNEGTLTGAFYSSMTRGEEQFDDRHFMDVFVGIAFSLSWVIGLYGAFRCGQILVNVSAGSKLLRLPLVVILLTLLSAPFLFSFSRASGAGFIICATAIYLFRRNKETVWPLIMLFLLGGLYLSLIGISQRFDGQMGLAVFFARAISPDSFGFDWFFEVQGSVRVLTANINFLDALGPLSASIHYSGNNETGVFQGFVWLLGILQPLPSFLLQIDYRPGASLSEALGTYGSTGITTPALGELHYLLGNWGTIPLFLFGVFLRSTDRFSEQKGAVPIFVLVLVLASVVVSGHSGIRAFARPATTAAILMFLYSHSFKIGKYRLDLRSRQKSKP